MNASPICELSATSSTDASSAIARLSESEFWSLAAVVEELAKHEGFPAHLATVEIRRH